MKEFNYDLDYKTIDFTVEENRKLYRIGRGEQGVLLVRPYTNDICTHWRFKTPDEAVRSSNKILLLLIVTKHGVDFISRFASNTFIYESPMRAYIVSIRANQ